MIVLTELDRLHPLSPLTYLSPRLRRSPLSLLTYLPPRLRRSSSSRTPHNVHNARVSYLLAFATDSLLIPPPFPSHSLQYSAPPAHLLPVFYPSTAHSYIDDISRTSRHHRRHVAAQRTSSRLQQSLHQTSPTTSLFTLIPLCRMMVSFYFF